MSDPVKALSPDAQQVYLAYQSGLFKAMGLVWLVMGIPSLWALREDLLRLVRYFTWTGLRFSLLYKPSWPSFGILFCLIFTLYVLMSQSRYEVLGLMDTERQLLETVAVRLRRLPQHHYLRRYFLQDHLSSPKHEVSQLPPGRDP